MCIRDSGYNAGYYKAAISGAIKENGMFFSSDAHYVNDISGLNEDIDDIVSYMYESEVSPHLAQKIEGNIIDLNKIKDDYDNLKSKYDYILTEGSGGIVCPIRYDIENKIMLEDIIKLLDLSAVIITHSSLGCINDAVLTCEYLKNRDICIKGVIMNNFDEENMICIDNRKMIEELTNCEVMETVNKNQKELFMDTKKLLKIFK